MDTVSTFMRQFVYVVIPHWLAHALILGVARFKRNLRLANAKIRRRAPVMEYLNFVMKLRGNNCECIQNLAIFHRSMKLYSQKPFLCGCFLNEMLRVECANVGF